MDDANCAQTDPNIFHPKKGDSAQPALSVCGTCTVIAQCQVFADRQPEPYGVLAGQSARDRRKARSIRRNELLEGLTA